LLYKREQKRKQFSKNIHYRRGRPKDTWRRVALKRLAAVGMKSWRGAAVVAQDRCERKSAGDDVLKALYGESCSAK